MIEVMKMGETITIVERGREREREGERDVNTETHRGKELTMKSADIDRVKG